jgi:hypothetical protein
MRNIAKDDAMGDLRDDMKDCGLPPTTQPFYDSAFDKVTPSFSQLSPMFPQLGPCSTQPSTNAALFKPAFLENRQGVF